MISEELTVHTGGHVGIFDITADVARFVADLGDGLLSVFVPHATAGIAVIEVGAGSDQDLVAAIDDLLPAEPARWRHEHGSPGHGRDHVLPAFVSPSVTIPVVAGKPTLGTWQAVVLVDTNVDNQTRRVRLSFIEG